VTLQVTEEMAWLFRSKVRTGDVAIDGHTNVGIPLLLKLYALLSAFNAEIAGLPPTSSEGEPAPTDEARDFLRLLKEENDAGRKASSNAGTDQDAQFGS
jgi:hypothetical protein